MKTSFEMSFTMSGQLQKLQLYIVVMKMMIKAQELVNITIKEIEFSIHV